MMTRRQKAQAAAGLVVGAGLLVGAYFAHRATRRPQPPQTVSAGVEDLGKKYPKVKKFFEDPRVGTLVKELVAAYHEGGPEAAKRLAKERGLMNEADEITLTVLTETDDTKAIEDEVEKEKGRVIGRGDRELYVAFPFALMEEQAKAGRDPEEVLKKISSMDNVRGLLPMEKPEPHQIRKTQGLKVIHGDLWQKAGARGAGIRVGILDPEVSKAPSFVGSVLPPSTSIYMGQCRSPSGTSLDGEGLHGAASAEIINEIAPDAQLFIACSVGDFDAAVAWLKAQNVRIISHSAGSISGRRNGTDRQQKLIDRLSGEGVLWINSMGNEGARFHRGRLAGKADWHEFAPGKTTMKFVQNEEPEIRLTLLWDEWDSKLPSDYDVYLFDADMKEIARSQNRNTVMRQPSEIVSARGIPGRTYHVGIRGNPGVKPASFVLDVRGAKTIELPTPGGSISAPADAKFAVAVGAVDWDTDKLAPYSARGPTEDGRRKPEIGAPTNVASTVYKGSFAGTSSSCPHVAGAAAVLWSKQPAMSRTDVLGVLFARAKDLGAPGPDNEFGVGRLDLGDPSQPLVATPVAAAPPVPTSTGNAPGGSDDGGDSGGSFEPPWRGIAIVLGLAGTGAIAMIAGFVSLVSAVVRRGRSGPAWHAWVTVVVGPNLGARREVMPGMPVTIGRTPDNGLVVPETGVSHRHAVVEWSPQGCWVKDAGSTNGTYVNGVRVQQQFLRPGDVIGVGTSKVRLDVTV